MLALCVYRGVYQGWCRHSAAEPLLPSSSSPGPNLHGRQRSPRQTRLLALSLPKEHRTRLKTSSSLADSPVKRKIRGLGPTSFFFFSSSFLFFSSRIWAIRCFFLSSSAFSSLLSDILQEENMTGQQKRIHLLLFFSSVSTSIVCIFSCLSFRTRKS